MPTPCGLEGFLPEECLAMPPHRPNARIVACLLACLAAVPLASAQSPQAGPMGADPMKADPMRADPMNDPADKAFMVAMTDMMAAMERIPSTGRTDEDFVRMMMPHHQAAVSMARTELTYGKDPALKAMANDIIVSQGQELATMKAWLAKNAK